MSTVVFQGFQSYLDPQLIETRTLRLKLAMPISSGNELLPDSRSLTPDSGGWAFLQTLSTTANSQESSYVHPMTKQSSSPLSGKSLELWTENLGSETGSEIGESSSLWLSSSPDNNSKVEGAEPVKELQHSKSAQCGKKASPTPAFPPPLTTITGTGGSIQFMPHREGGRLVIKALQAPSPQPYFQTERSHGRLRLSFWRDYCSSTSALDLEEEDSTNIDEDGDMEEEGEEEAEEEGGEEEEEEGEEEEEEEEESEWKVGMEKIQRGKRCIEGGNGNKNLCNWEAFWVATS
ncbi:protein FANTASTIC FOUR 3 [Diospyros lotus]|uniref:protein FANTASTIC FOUR 3 n=1 Tax=Diospyros lotus TaxID=55363 RepID=UPI0022562E47|nr:protein FANTASTIC FOUR 3 [Diospyros lotus]